MISPADIQGHWVRQWIKAPGFEDHTTRVHWKQVGLNYADLRIPRARPDLTGAAALSDLPAAALLDLAQAEGFAGQVTLSGDHCTWHREINWHGPSEAQDVGAIRFDDDGQMIETGVHADYAELWQPNPGAGAFLRVDANQGYRTARNAIDILARLRDAGADACEQPGANLTAMAEITRRGALPVMADESCWDAVDAMDVVAAGAADWISIYLAKAGGFVGARKVDAIAHTMNIRTDVNGSIESAIGNAANVHFALAAPSVTLPCVIPVSAPSGTHPCKVAGNYYTDDILTEPMQVQNGAILPLDKPGLGIEIDEGKLEHYRQDRA